jgi:hypothetical protein
MVSNLKKQVPTFENKLAAHSKEIFSYSTRFTTKTWFIKQEKDD